MAAASQRQGMLRGLASSGEAWELRQLRERLLGKQLTEYAISNAFSIPELRRLIAACGIRTSASRKPVLVRCKIVAQGSQPQPEEPAREYSGVSPC